MNIGQPVTGMNDEAEIRAMMARWSRAVETGDAQGAVADYASDVVLFDAVPPYRTDGAEEIRQSWERCFPHFPEKRRSIHRNLAVTISGDMAVAHGLHKFEADEADHPSGQTWMRVTVCFRRVEGRWQVFHEHISVPFDPISGRAEFIARP